jgi:hypothetical protein
MGSGPQMDLKLEILGSTPKVQRDQASFICFNIRFVEGLLTLKDNNAGRVDRSVILIIRKNHTFLSSAAQFYDY